MDSPPLTPRRAVLVCITAVLTALMCAGMCAAAVLTPAPAAVVPFVAIVCVCCPMVTGWELPGAVEALRGRRLNAEAAALADLRRGLALLPETDHPLGL